MLREQGKLPRDPSLSQLATSGSFDSETTDSSLGHVQSNIDFQPGHKRSASADLDRKVDNASNIKESVRTDHKNLGPKTQSFSISNKQNMPVHLMSATNELKIGAKNVQQLPSKLISSSASSPPQPGGALQVGLKHVAPGLVTQGNNSGSPSQLSATHGSSSPSLVSEGGEGSNNLSHSSSASHIGNHGNSKGQGQHNTYGSSVTVPMGGRHSNRPKPSAGPPAGISGLLKLAEKGDKKGKSLSSSQLLGADKGPESSPVGQRKSPEGQQRPKSGNPKQRGPISHKQQKSDSDVIYF